MARCTLSSGFGSKGLQICKETCWVLWNKPSKEKLLDILQESLPHVGEREWASRILNSPLRDDQSLKEMDAAFKGTCREKGRVSSNHLTTYFWHSFYLTAFQRSRTPAWRRGKRCPGADPQDFVPVKVWYTHLRAHTGISLCTQAHTQHVKPT